MIVVTQSAVEETVHRRLAMTINGRIQTQFYKNANVLSFDHATTCPSMWAGRPSRSKLLSSIEICTGTKSVLFGIHQFLLHPVFVLISWILIYGQWPNWKELVAIFFHDIGYIGKREMDGADGVLHPELGARITMLVTRCETAAQLAKYHSRTYAARSGANPSKLCLPDKLAILLYPKWLFILLGRLSGEIAQYKKDMNATHLSDQEWLERLRCGVLIWAEQCGHHARLSRFRVRLRKSRDCHRDPAYNVSATSNSTDMDGPLLAERDWYHLQNPLPVHVRSTLSNGLRAGQHIECRNIYLG